MDAGDEAQELAAQLEEIQRKYRGAVLLEVEPTGHCLNCGNMDIIKGMRWCNSECRNDWQNRR